MSPSAIVNTPIGLLLRNSRFRLPAIVYSEISMDDTSLCFRTAVDLAGMIRDKKVSALEVMEAHLVQIEKTNPKVNAIITMDGEQALARAKQADEAFIEEHIARIADDPDGRYVYLGDGGECVTKASKGELYEQQLSPDEQLDRVVELLEPIRGKGLFGVSGNHDRRISKLSGLDWTKALCVQLGIPYMGISCFSNISVYYQYHA